jgi:hypothetical protein
MKSVVKSRESKEESYIAEIPVAFVAFAAAVAREKSGVGSLRRNSQLSIVNCQKTIPHHSRNEVRSQESGVRRGVLHRGDPRCVRCLRCGRCEREVGSP